MDGIDQQRPAGPAMRRPRRLTSLLAILAILAAAGGTVALVQQRHAADAAAHEATLATPRLPVELVRLGPAEPLTVEERFTGRIVPRREVRIGFEVGGRISEVAVDIGDRVAAGAALARLDTRRLEARGRALEANRAEIAAQLAYAEAELTRQSTLQARGHAAREALERARSEVGALRARDDALAAELAIIRADLADSTLTAPFAALVVERMVERGGLADPAQPAFRLQELGTLEARIGVPLRLAETLEPGSMVTVTQSGRMLEGRVRALVPEVAAMTRTVTVVVSLAETAGVAAGAAVELRTERTIAEPGFWVPLQALVAAPRGQFALQLAGQGEDGLVVARAAVEVLHQAGDRAFVRGALAAGDLAILAGSHRVVPGQPIRPAGEVTMALGR